MYKTLFTPLLLSLSLILTNCDTTSNQEVYDVVVVGGGTSGIAAGISSARLGAKTILIEQGPWLGGMLTSAGVSAVDGNNKLPSGFWGEFRDSLVGRYGSLDAMKTGWVSNTLFEPHIGNDIFHNIAKAESKLTLKMNQSWNTIHRVEPYWVIELSEGHKIRTKQLVEATELGDVIQELEVSHRIGMDSKDDYDEYIAPNQSNDIIQDLTYALILKDYGEPKIIDQPKGYDPSVFYCATQSEKCNEESTMMRTLWPKERKITYGKLPNDKYMINWPINGNDYYVNAIYMSPEERDSVFELAKLKSLQFLYYLQTELGFENLSIADDEFPTDDGLPLIPYHRESLRIDGVTTLSMNHLSHPYEQSHPTYRTSIAVGDYPVDHHHAAHPQADELPELHFYPVPSYSIPLGSLIPETQENLVVAEKSISVSNIVNGTTRLQPVVLQIGQAAGIVAASAALSNDLPKNIDMRKIQKRLLDNGHYLMPFLDVQQSHPHFRTYQRIGVTGILRGTGKNIGWENQTWFYPDSNLRIEDIFIDEYIDTNRYPLPESLTQSQIIDWFLNYLNDTEASGTFSRSEMETFINYDGDQPERIITRGEFSVLLNALIQPFEQPVTLLGELSSTPLHLKSLTD